MDGLSIITGIGLTVFLLLYFAFNLEKKHYLLQVFTIALALFMLLLIPSATKSLEYDCGINSTGSYFCYYENGSQVTDFGENNTSVGTTFVKSYNWFLTVFSIYLFIYFATAIFMWFQRRNGEK